MSANARSPAELAAVSRPIEELQSEVGGIADLVTTGVHGRLARDVEGLAAQDRRGRGRGADPAAIEGLDRISLPICAAWSAEMAEPQRVHALALQVAELERAGWRSSAAASSTPTRSSAASTASRASSTSSTAGPRATSPARIEALSEKLDRLGEKPRITFAPPAEGIDTLVQRLDRLDETLARNSAPQLGSIEEMLRTLVERIDQVGTPGRRRRRARLARQAGLAPGAAPRARTRRPGARRARAHDVRPHEPGRAHALRQPTRRPSGRRGPPSPTRSPRSRPAAAPGLDPSSATSTSSRRSSRAPTSGMQTTLESVHAALEKVVGRLAVLEQDGGAAEPALPRVAEAPQTVRVKAAAPPAPRPPRPPQPAAPQVSLDEADRPLPPAGEEILLEPGAARPRPARSGGDARGRAERRRQGELHRGGPPGRAGGGRGSRRPGQGQERPSRRLAPGARRGCEERASPCA